MQRPEGTKCNGSGYGYPHGKDKHVERVKRVAVRREEKVKAPDAVQVKR